MVYISKKMKFKNKYSRDKSIELIEQYCKGREIRLIPKDIKYGIQYSLEKGDDKVAINFYDSGTILTQGNKNSLQKDIENYIDKNLDDNALTKLTPKELKGSVSYTLRDNTDVLNLRKAFEGFEGIKEFEEDIPIYVDYVLNIIRGGTSFKITQYKSRKLLIQGRFSGLYNEAVSIADQHCNPPVEDLIHGATSEDSQSLVKKGITVEEFEVANKLHPKIDYFQDKLVIAYTKMGDYDKAEKTLVNLIRFVKKDWIYRDLAIVYHKKGRLQDAEREFKNALRKVPNNHKNHYFLELVYVD